MVRTLRFSIQLFALAASVLANAQTTSKQAMHHAWTQKHLAAQGVQRGGVSNDDCAGAIELTVGTSCTPESYTIAGATSSLPAILCNGFTSTAANDVWFSYTANTTSTVVRVDGVGDFDAVLEHFTGDCSGLTSIGCTDNTFPNPDPVFEQVTLTTVPGTTYYVRVYGFAPPASASSAFTICVYQIGGGSAPNDACEDAVPQAVTAGNTTTFNGDNTGATLDPTPVTDVDGIQYPAVWESFTTTECLDITLDYCGTVATGTQFRVLFTGCPDLTNLARTQIFDNTTCGDGNYTFTFLQVPPGTYLIPIVADPAGTPGPYTINVTGTPCGTTPPANDECLGAISLTMGSDCLNITGDVLGGTESLPADACGGFTGSADEDVWFSFVATASTALIEVDGSISFDAVFGLFQGPCSNLTFMGCVDGTLDDGVEAGSVSGLNVGETYYIRVYDWYIAEPTTTDFQICVHQTVANDDCSGAIALDVHHVSECPALAITGSNAAATQSLGDPSCDATTGFYQDVWYSFNSIANTSVFIDLVPDVNMTDWGFAIYDACTGADILCTTVPDPGVQLITDPNTDYLIRVSSNTQFGVGGDFTLCVYGDFSTGMVETGEVPEWNISPNPGDGVFRLTPNASAKRAAVDVFDAVGRTVHTNSGPMVAGAPWTLDLSDLAKGTYTVRLTIDGARSEKRLMKN